MASDVTVFFTLKNDNESLFMLYCYNPYLTTFSLMQQTRIETTKVDENITSLK